MWWLLLAWIASEFIWVIGLWQSFLLLLFFCPITVYVAVRHRIWLPLLLCLCGVLLGQLSVSWQRSLWLPVTLDGHVLRLTGQVTDLPERRPSTDARPASQVLILRNVRLAAGEKRWPGAHRIRVYDYGAHHYRPGDNITIDAKLYRPRGLVNEGSADLARLDLARGQAASGSIRRLVKQLPGNAPIDQLRDKISQRLQQHLASYPQAAGLVAALVVGDWRYLSPDSWKLYQRAGVAHLVVISGEHLTLIAGLAWLFFRISLVPVARLSRGSFSAQQLAVPPALLVASGYCLLAGWSVSTLRALVMLTVWLLCRLLRRRWPTQRVLAMALLIIFVWQPLSPLSHSFWLSFLAVAVLILVVESRPSLLVLQAIMSLVVGALAAFLFAQWWSVDVVANLLLIPVFSFILVPAALLGALLPGMTWLLLLIAPLIHWQETGLSILLESAVRLPIPATWQACALVMLALLIGLGRFLPWPRWSLPFLLLPWLWPQVTSLDYGEFEFIVFDVGQGQATLIRTPEGIVIYDMGPSWLTSDAGERVLLPWLRRQRQSVLLAFASHGDRDHVGGLVGIREALPLSSLLSGEPNRVKGSRDCYRGQYWHFSGVEFRVLWPPENLRMTDNNSMSCVVRVSSRYGTVLLTGDIPQQVEFWLLMNQQKRLSAEVLLLAHHGSASSSSYAFLRAVKPELAIASAGYLNHLGHPTATVRQKLQDLSIPLLRTDLHGMLTVSLTAQGVSVRRERDRRRSWEDPLATAMPILEHKTKRRIP